MSDAEWFTRNEDIDKRLRGLPQPCIVVRWADELETSKLSRRAVEEFPTGNDPADYALFVDDIIEVKKVSVIQNVPGQAKRYSKGYEPECKKFRGLVKYGREGES